MPFLSVLLMAAASWGGDGGGAAISQNLILTSPDFVAEGRIPSQFTCQGSNISPALKWDGVPANTQSFAITVLDPDAPGGNFTHWVVWNLPANLRGLAQGAKPGVSGINHFGKVGYGGPCPPHGQTHRYIFTLYALNQKLTLQEGATREELETTIKDHTLDSAKLTGTFQRNR